MTDGGDRPEAKAAPAPPDRLDSWKAIAAYLNRGITTVQRWEQEDGLPVHRLPHAKKGSVFSTRHEIDEWMGARSVTRGQTIAAAPLEPDDADGSTSHPSTLRGRRIAAAVVALGSMVVAMVWAMGIGRSKATASESRYSVGGATPLMTSNGAQRAPAFSPDGREIAFAWDRTTSAGIYVQAVPAGLPRLLWTYDAELQGVFILKWSPSGEWIAFNTEEGEDVYGLYVLSPRTGARRRLTTMAGVGICWDPESRSITFADRASPTEPFALHVISVDGGTRQRLTSPPSGVFGDTACARSRDGRWLAFSRFLTRFDADVLLTPSEGRADPRALTSSIGGIDDLEWTLDDKAIVVAGAAGLTLVPLDAGPSMSMGAPAGTARHPTVALDAHDGVGRLAYEMESPESMHAMRWQSDRADVFTPFDPSGHSPADFVTVSPDGRRVAYTYLRELWVVNADGTDRRQVTSLSGGDTARIATGPAWSPDGTRLAFSVPIGGHRDIYRIDADGSRSIRLTSEPSLEDNPSWSRDGRTIYFRSDRGGLNRIWKMGADGGEAVRVTQGEGVVAMESFDGRLLYFVRGTNQPGLWAVPVNGGRETFVHPDVRDGLWSADAAGVVFLQLPTADHPRLQRIDVATGRTRDLAALPPAHYQSFSMTADGRQAFWTMRIDPSRHIMVVHPWPGAISP